MLINVTKKMNKKILGLYKEDFGRWYCFREYVMPDSRVTLSNSIELFENNDMILVQSKYPYSVNDLFFIPRIQRFIYFELFIL